MRLARQVVASENPPGPGLEVSWKNQRTKWWMFMMFQHAMIDYRDGNKQDISKYGNGKSHIFHRFNDCPSKHINLPSNALVRVFSSQRPMEKCRGKLAGANPILTFPSAHHLRRPESMAKADWVCRVSMMLGLNPFQNTKAT
jgi:hypothetical protein